MTLPAGRHFTPAEAACHDGTPFPEEWADRWALSCGLADACRDEWGHPLEALSWYRTAAYNFRLAADSTAHQVASGSQHVKGLAIDLRPIGGGDASMLYRVLLAAHDAGRLPSLGGIGLYVRSNWVHVDCRAKPPDGHLARWLGI
jgi:hypothetical protein